MPMNLPNSVQAEININNYRYKYIYDVLVGIILGVKEVLIS